MRKGVGVTHNVFGDLDGIAWVRGWSFKYECSIQQPDVVLHGGSGSTLNRLPGLPGKVPR